MLDRMAAGELPRKHHLQLRGPDGALRYEECVTREGFDGPYTLAYHLHRPQAQAHSPTRHGWTPPVALPPMPLAKRHLLTLAIPSGGGAPVDARVPLAFNSDLVFGVLKPDRDDPVYFVNGDGDDLFYVFRGGGTVRSALGDVRFGEGDYVYVPKGIVHRILVDADVEQHWVSVECLGGVQLPRQWRNATGQLRMDAPYCHRDFRRPVFEGPRDEGIRETVIKRRGAFHGMRSAHSPLDVVGWDGTSYPWAFAILDFQPRVSTVHLPPTWHGTFATRGALICSFVPRLVDFHPEAIPCPYPHSSVDCDEILFYCSGNFTSRRGVGPGSVSLHPMGVPHGPHPGAYEASIGSRETSELAVMLDTFAPLDLTAAAAAIEDAGYHASFID